MIIGLPIRLPWDKEERQPTLNTKNIFLRLYETMEDTKNGMQREILPSHWYEVALHILKYIYT